MHKNNLQIGHIHKMVDTDTDIFLFSRISRTLKKKTKNGSLF